MNFAQCIYCILIQGKIQKMYFFNSFKPIIFRTPIVLCWRHLCNYKMRVPSTAISYIHTLKKSNEEPVAKVPYLISVCLARSSAPSIGICICSIVRKAAKLAVYDEIMINTKNHQTVPIIRPENDLKIKKEVQMELI